MAAIATTVRSTRKQNSKIGRPVVPRRSFQLELQSVICVNKPPTYPN